MINRRTFLSNTALAGAGSLLVSSLADKAAAAVATSASSPNSQLNVAIVGLGAQGRILLESMINIPGLKFRAVCDIWEYAQRYGKNKLKRAGHDVNTYIDIDDMLEKEKDLDAVVIATPDFWHSPHTVKCLKAGLHVYCEKMMSNTIEGARNMVLAARETGKLLQIGHQRYSNPRYQFIYNKLLQESKVQGRFVGAMAQWNRAVADDLGYPKAYTIKPEILAKYGYKDMHQFRNWRWFKALSGGPISDLGAHQIDVFNWFLGVHPQSVIASGGVDYYKNHEHYDNVMCIYEYPLPTGTIRAFYQVQTATSSGGGYYETFMGDQGTVVSSENPKNTSIFRENNAPDWEYLIKKNYLRHGKAPAEDKNALVDVRETKALVSYEIPVVLNKPVHQPHLENFFDSIRGKATLNCDSEKAFASSAAIFQVNPAIESKERYVFKPSDFVV